jgi:ABC-2 type transport system permease protein
MHNIFLIAKREYFEQIRGRAFRISTILVPLLIACLIGANYFAAARMGAGKHIAIAAADARLAEDVRQRLLDDKDAKLTVDVVTPASEADQAALLGKIKAKELDGVLTIGEAVDGAPALTYASESSADLVNTRWLKTAVKLGLAEGRLRAGGMSADQVNGLLENVKIEPLHLGKDGKTAKSEGMSPVYKANVLLILIIIPITLYGMDMARAIVEEKSSRIFEVMLSVARPIDLLTGKLLGVGAVGLTQVAIWGLAMTIFLGSTLAASVMTGDFAVHISVAEVALLPVYFLLAFFLYSALFSGLGATCETAQDLQMYVPLIIVPMYLSMAALAVCMNSPGSPWAIAASLFPLTAGFVMVPRMGLETVPLWQIAASIAIMLLSIWGTMWFSSRLYRVGILMYGKRATLPEIWRWLRYS